MGTSRCGDMRCGHLLRVAIAARHCGRFFFFQIALLLVLSGCPLSDGGTGALARLVDLWIGLLLGSCFSSLCAVLALMGPV